MFAWWSNWYPLPMAQFRAAPGVWKAELLLDGDLAATMSFVVRPASSTRYGLTPLDAIDAIRRGEAREALAYYAARGAELALGDRESRIRAAKAYGAATYLAGLVGEYRKGIESGRRASEVLASFPSIREVVEQRAQLQLFLGHLYAWTGDFDEARARLQEVLALTTRFDQNTVYPVVYSAIAWFGLSGMAFLQSDYPAALERARTSLSLYEQVFARMGSTDPAPGIFLHALLLAGMSSLELGRLDDAETLLRRALAGAVETHGDDIQAMTRGALALLAYRRGDIRQAQAESDLALSEGQRLGLTFFTTRLLSRRGSMASEQARYADALDAYRKAIWNIEDVRSQIAESSLRMLFFEDKHAIYHGAALSALSLGRPAEAFDFAERGRARAFLDLLGTTTLISKEQTAELLLDEARLKHRFDEAQAVMQFISSGLHQGGGSNAGPDLARSGRELRDVAVTEYERFLARVKKENPEQAALMSVEPLTLPEVQGLLDDRTTLLEYLVTPKETVAWVITRSTVKAVRLPVSRSELVAEVRRFRNAITERVSLELVKNISQRLYDHLLAPLRMELRSDHLLIVPHDVLHYLPFTASGASRAAGSWRTTPLRPCPARAC